MFNPGDTKKLGCDSERIWKIIDKYSPREKAQKKPESDSIFDNLYNCYINNLNSDKRFRATNLLQKLSSENAKVTFIVNLYSDENGYSIMLSPNADEVFLPYENNEIFNYLDSCEIPPVLLEIIGKTKFCHLYNGCVICEVRNYRVPYLLKDQSYKYDSQLLLLRPSPETQLSLINQLSQQTGCYNKEDKLLLESQILLATQPPICLDPDIDVVCVQNRLQYNKKKYHNHSLRRYLRKQCQARRYVMNLYSEGPHPPSLSLRSFLIDQRLLRDNSIKHSLASLKHLKKKNVITKPFTNDEISIEILKFAKAIKSDVAQLLHDTSTITPDVNIPINTKPQNNSESNEYLDTNNREQQIKKETAAIVPAVPAVAAVAAAVSTGTTAAIPTTSATHEAIRDHVIKRHTPSTVTRPPPTVYVSKVTQIPKLVPFAPPIMTTPQTINMPTLKLLGNNTNTSTVTGASLQPPILKKLPIGNTKPVNVTDTLPMPQLHKLPTTTPTFIASSTKTTPTVAKSTPSVAKGMPKSSSAGKKAKSKKTH